MIKLHFEKIYKNNRNREHIYFGVPFKKGSFTTPIGSIKDNAGKYYPCYVRPTSYWDDGSIKWLFVRAMLDLPGNGDIDYYFSTEENVIGEYKPVEIKDNVVKTGNIKLALSLEKNRLFDYICFDGNEFDNFCISSPVLTAFNNKYDFKVDSWHIKEASNICTVLTGKGYHSLNNENIYEFQINLTFYAEKDWFELGYKLINTSLEPLEIDSILIKHNQKGVRNTVASSNYKTDFKTGDCVEKLIDAQYLKYEANEHNAEVFYGVFFADTCDENTGLCATVYQAYQNFPKAVYADTDGFIIKLVPETENKIIMQSGMAREQKVLFHFHNNWDLQQLNDRAIIYQMPDRPMIEPQVFQSAKVFENVFTSNPNWDIELYLTGRADEHARCYGMLNWGDSADANYTKQGRGKGELVWTNNEYDFPHACTLMYARTGVRRYMDYVLVAGKHWMDVDICHYSDNPLELNGQWEHTNGHCKNGTIVCSHQWVEGLLDYYHLTGDIEALNTAIGIGKNVQRLLETPTFQKSGQANARETGWALRTLTALYVETNDKSWLEKCDWIVGHFKQWKDEYGLWLAPYTDNTAIRVVFMISVAICSLMRYYRISKNSEIKNMILEAVDDLLENARLDNGLFYYKELPSLKRLGNNPIILEALTYAYELTGDKKYLEAGIPTFKYSMQKTGTSFGGDKKIIEDTVMVGGIGTKGFAQMMVPYTIFYCACRGEGIL